jgi:hypothetical protein
MPFFSVVSVRLALVYLLVGFSMGALLLANKGLAFYPQIWSLLNPHVEILIFGWMVHLILGVAYWILPRLPLRGRGKTSLAWTSLLLFNIGIGLAIVPSLWEMDSSFLFFGKLAEAGAALAFALHAWERIRPTDMRGRNSGKIEVN